MNVLIIGTGGREHALAWKIAASPRLGKLFALPGNPGMAKFATNVDIAGDDYPSIIKFAEDNDINLVVVGPEVPLADGLADMLAEKDIATFGPSKSAARIESSKAFSKDLMNSLGVPTAKYKNFTDYEEAKAYLEEQGAPIVVKASGLAAGKGAIVCQTMDEAQAAIKEIMLDRVFGKGEGRDEVVIEEFMEGPEISIHVLTDGENYITLPPSQDHKAIGEGNTGPNTGGMGTLAPLEGVSDELMQRIDKEIVEPIITGMKEAGSPYTGLLYPGLMLTKDGPKVIEFNCRFGDPEVQTYLRLLDNDLLDVLEASVSGGIKDLDLKWSSQTAVNIVLASGGYPESYDTDVEMTGIDEAEANSDVVVFHAGTKLDGSRLLTNGGRVLGVSAVGDNLDDALEKAYEAADKIQFEGKALRRDIGHAHDNSRLADF